MKLNISCPATGCQKPIAIDDDKKLSIFYGRRMGQEVEGDALGDEFKGYIFKITGGNDKDGFSMKQGVLVQGRVRLLMKEGHKCYRPRRAGERKRKSVRGCIVGPDLSVIALAIVKVGEQPIAGLTDTKVPKRLGPKRASNIRKLFALSKDDDVRRFVIRRKIEKEGKPVRYKAPRIQRLVTDARLRRKRIYKAHKKARWERTRKAVVDYQKVVDEYKKRKSAEAKEELAHKKEAAHEAHLKKKAKLRGSPKKSPVKKGAEAAAEDKKGADKKATTQDKKGQQAAPAKTTQAAGKSAPAQQKAAPAQQKAAPAQTQQKAAPAGDKKGAQPQKSQAAQPTKGKK